MLINSCAPLLPKDTIRRAEDLSVALLCDGITKAGLDLPGGGCMCADIMPVNRTMKVVGTAITVETGEGNNFPIHVASYSVGLPGYIMVIDGKGYTERAYFGDLIMGACQAAGFEGMVVDGMTRDRDGNIDDLDNFPVYSRGFMPRGPVKTDQGAINTPIMCGGVWVNPGDLVVGDSDGVVVIPREYIEIVLAKAEEKESYEKKRRQQIAAYRKAVKENAPLPELAPGWVLDMLNK